MTKDEFKRFPESHTGRIKLRVKDMKDKSDRTLFCDVVETMYESVHHHAYLKDGVLHVVQYIKCLKEGYVKHHFWGDELMAKLVVPPTQLTPTYTDYEAALKLYNLGVEFEFLSEYSSPEEPQAFWGMIFEELDQSCYVPPYIE